MTSKVVNLKELRLLVNYKEVHRSLCKILFTSKDSSVYLIPYASTRTYHYGKSVFENGELKNTFDFTIGVKENIEPKLSIHESGKVHIQSGKVTVDPLQTVPLKDLRGQHIATISVDRFEGLPKFKNKILDTRSTAIRVLKVHPEIESGRLAIYVNGKEFAFNCGKCPIHFALTRKTLVSPLYIGIKPIGQLPIGEKARPGVTVIAGWNPTLTSPLKTEYLYIRGE